MRPSWRHRNGLRPKTLFPGARVGFAVADQLVTAADGATGLLADELSRMRATIHELDRCFPPEARAGLGVRAKEPTVGFFVSLDVPFRADNEALAVSAKDFGVIWTPMSYFHPRGGGEHSLRLSVSNLTRDEIVEGVHRPAGFIRSRPAG